MTDRPDHQEQQPDQPESSNHPGPDASPEAPAQGSQIPGKGVSSGSVPSPSSGSSDQAPYQAAQQQPQPVRPAQSPYRQPEGGIPLKGESGVVPRNPAPQGDGQPKPQSQSQPQGQYPPAGRPSGSVPRQQPQYPPRQAQPQGGQSRPPAYGQPPHQAQQQQPQQQQYGGYQAPPRGYNQPPGGGYAGPPPNAPAPKKIKRSPIPMIIGLIILVFVGGGTVIAIISGLIASSSGTGGGGGGGMFAFGDKIAILEVDGVIGAGEAYGSDTERLRKLVAKWKDDESVKGMIIRVNSPGGAVSATQDLYTEINEFRATGKKVYTSMGDIAASGGYYLAMSSDEVWVNSGTLTGSIGVILSFYGYEELFDKIGLESRAIKSGQFKDIGSGTRPMTEEEKELLNTMIDDVFEQFFEVVYANRMEAARVALAAKRTTEQNAAQPINPTTITNAEVEEYLRGYCDGRIFSGRQALEYGMADKEGTFQETIDAMRLALGLPEDSTIVTTPKPQPGFFGMFDQKISQMQQFQPGTVLLEFRFSM